MNDTFNVNLGKEIKTYRKARNLTQKQLAKNINKSVACISKYEKGEISIDVYTLCELCTVLNISPMQLLNHNNCKKNDDITNNSVPFFHTNPLFMYWYDGNRKSIHKGAIVINHELNTATLYLYIKDYNDYKSCKYLFSGDVSFYNPFARLTLKNINDEADLIMMTIYNMGDHSNFRVGQLYILSYYYQPMVTKCIVCNKPLDKDTILKHVLVSKEDVKYFKDTNFMLSLNTNI